MKVLRTDDEKDTVLLDHAWRWFAMHASQRMQTINLYIVVLGVLLTATGFSIKEKIGEVEVVLGITISVVSLLFAFMEMRVRRLIRLGEAALRKEESRLAKRTRIPEAEIIRAADESGKKMVTYGMALSTLFCFFVVVGLAAFVHGIVRVREVGEARLRAAAVVRSVVPDRGPQPGAPIVVPAPVPK